MLFRSRQRKIKDLAPYVIEEDIDQALRGRSEFLVKVFILVVESVVESELLQPLDLVVATGEAKDCCTLQLGNLTDDRTSCSSGA